MPTSPHSAKRCHSEPVRTLAWESVSPRLPLRGRCQREALTEGEMPRVFLSLSRLRRQPPPRGGLTARRCRADGTPSPTRGSTYRPVGRGPRAPPPSTHFSAGHMGPALQRCIPPQKNNAAPRKGRCAFSVHVWHRRRRVIFAAVTSGNRGGLHLKAERTLTYLETTYHVFFTSLLHNFNKNMETRVFRSHVKAIKRHKQPLCPLIASPPKGRRGLGKGY